MRSRRRERLPCLAEKIRREVEHRNSGPAGGFAVLLRVAHMGGTAEVNCVRGGQVQEHPGPWLATQTFVLVDVRADPPVRERPPEMLVQPGEAAVNLGCRDLAPGDTRLVGDNETRVEGGTHLTERARHAGYEDRVAVPVDHGAPVFYESEGSPEV